jgi:hypothetical protein
MLTGNLPQLLSALRCSSNVSRPASECLGAHSYAVRTFHPPLSSRCNIFKPLPALGCGSPEIDSRARQHIYIQHDDAKTPMHKNTAPKSRQYNIWISRQVLAMKSGTVTMCMQKTPDRHCRLDAPLLRPAIMRDLVARSATSI